MRRPTLITTPFPYCRRSCIAAGVPPICMKELVDLAARASMEAPRPHGRSTVRKGSARRAPIKGSHILGRYPAACLVRSLISRIDYLFKPCTWHTLPARLPSASNLAPRWKYPAERAAWTEFLTLSKAAVIPSTISRVGIEQACPITPRFNMAFELGLAVAWDKLNGASTSGSCQASTQIAEVAERFGWD